MRGVQEQSLGNDDFSLCFLAGQCADHGENARSMQGLVGFIDQLARCSRGSGRSLDAAGEYSQILVVTKTNRGL